MAAVVIMFAPGQVTPFGLDAITKEPICYSFINRLEAVLQ